MKVETMVLGEVRTNCYLVSDEATREAVIIDPADQAEEIIKRIEEKGLTLKGVLLTHGHFDHIYAAEALCSHFHISSYAGEDEKELLQNPQWNCSFMGSRPVTMVCDVWVKDQETLNLGGLVIKVISTPGHTGGGVCYYFEKDSLLFSGDTLFFESVGRSDLPTANGAALLKAIETKLYVLPEETKVYPGHGRATQIGYEKKNNPYTNGDYWE